MLFSEEGIVQVKVPLVEGMGMEKSCFAILLLFYVFDRRYE